MSAFTLLTLNIHQGMAAFFAALDLLELRAAVREVHADVLCLQEVRGASVPASGEPGAEPPASDGEFIAENAWPHLAYGRNAIFPRGHMGNALLSKFPIARFRNHDASIAGSEKRGMLWCELDVPGAAPTVHVVSLHLGLIEAHRHGQLNALCALVDSGTLPPDAPLIVAGDFNDWRRQADGVLQRCGLAEAFVGAAGRHARTFPARFPRFTLDRIYTRNIAVDRAKVLQGPPWSRLSDHLPLLVHVTPRA